MKKGKVSIIWTIILVSLTTSTALAVSNPKEKLNQWYSIRLESSTSTIKKDLDEHMETKIIELKKFKNELIDDSRNNFHNTSKDAASRSTGNISNYNDKYVANIEESMDRLKPNIHKDFDSILKETNRKSKEQLDDEIETYLSELNAGLDKLILEIED